ncbi:MAG: radical SAM protein [Verrucomicrobia bacterium]|nr:radical SAM protein [Verrucomicrobiota bacterium]
MDLNSLRFGLRLVFGRLTGKMYPFLVQFNVTNRCNLKCRYCYAGYYARPTEDMPLDQVKAIIDELVLHGLFRINLVGGEPLMRPDIGAIIEHVRCKGIHCAITTNGWLVPKKLDALRGLNLCCFSIDGDRPGNDENRGAGTFDRVIAGLDACKAAGIPAQISAVLSCYTVNDVDFLVGLAERYGSQVGFATLISQSREGCTAAEDLAPSSSDLAKALGRIVELKEQGKPILFSPEAYRYALRWPDHSENVIRGRPPGFPVIPCFAGRYFCLIDYNGDLYPCPQLVGILKPKNVIRDGFAEAFRHASQHNCQTCSVPCSNNFNMFFGLRPGVLWEHFRKYHY